MTQEDKELLLKDLSGRLPYGIVINTGDKNLKLDRKHQGIGVLYPEDCSDEFNKRNNNPSFYITISGCYYGEEIKPYLRSLSSMTEEEEKEYRNIDNRSYSCPMDYAHIPASDRIDWLNKHHFDYRGLIEKGLAIKVNEDNNPYILSEII